MVLKCVKDVLLREVAKGLKQLATSVLYHMSTTPSSSSSDTRWLHMAVRLRLERLLLLHCRSEDVLEEFSGYYCLRLLLDVRSPHATYFIDLFYQLEWLLEALYFAPGLPTDLFDKTCTLLYCIQPAIYSCRYLFVVSEISKPAEGITFECSKYESSNILQTREEIHRSGIRRSQLQLLIDREKSEIRRSQLKLDIDQEESGIRRRQEELSRDPIEIEFRRTQEEIRRRQEEIGMERREEIHMKRKAEAHRDLPMDGFHAGLKLLPFGNLDVYAGANRVELGRKLGEGSCAAVYEGNFTTQNHQEQTQQIIGQPVAVKMFGSGGTIESEGSIIHTRELGSQFFKQMEAMVELKKSSHSLSGFTIAECNEMLFSVATASRQTEKMPRDEKLSEELWNLVTAKHPNIISARGYIGRRDEGESGLVMELMSTSLQEYLEEVAEPVQEQEMVDIMLETAKGMRFLHECDLVHKDLKPRNILLRSGKQPMINGRWSKYATGAMEVKLADFGLAQRIVTKGDAQGSETDTCERAGTYCYMAPELLRYSQFPPSSNNQDKMDVFSYGTTCFNILTCKDAGALAFTRAESKKSAATFYEAVRSGDWRAWVKGKPEYLIDLIARCWAFDPRQRPTFAAICCLLQRAMLCILAPPVIHEKLLEGAHSHSRYIMIYMLKGIMESSGGWYTIIGTSRMERCLQNFTKFSYMSLNTSLGGSPRSSFLGELEDNAIAFLERWRYKGSKIDTRRTEATIGRGVMAIARGIMARKSLAAPFRKKFGSSAESGSACSDPETIVNADQHGSNIFTSKAVIRLRRQGPAQDERSVGAQQLLHIPLTTMEPQWNVFKALVCCSIFKHFYFMPGTRFVNWRAFDESKIRGLKLFPFEKDDAKMDLDVDESLMPFLVCFWESGCGRSIVL